MSNSLVENRFLKLHKLVSIQLQIWWIKEISNIMHLGFHRVFDLAFLKKEKTSITQNQQRFIMGTGRQIAEIAHSHPMGYFYTGSPVTGTVLSCNDAFIKSVKENMR